MYIIGTSGHIDHGKTSLIQALSGIDCDRLPEEKAREMTIDIGFASMEYPRFGTVSIVDVPGHERFIRNMVTGAWGIDLGVLVVAVDDGWMPQTEDHFRVLELLGIEKIVVALNKVDLADEEMIDMVIMEVNERLAGTPYEGADIVQVSAKKGTGIEELREVIVANLRTLQKAPDNQKPYLLVDRVFSVKGHGTVVTGTLKNGSFVEDENATILPGSREARIKKIESHYQEFAQGAPSQRTALNLTGVTADELERGHVVVRHNFFTQTSELVARITVSDQSFELKNNHTLEVLIGTASMDAKIIFNESHVTPEGLVCRFKLDAPWNVYPGQPFIITTPGGYRVIGGGRVLLPRYSLVRDKAFFQELLQVSLEAESLVLMLVKALKYMDKKHLSSMFPVKNEKMEKTVGRLIDAGDLTLLGERMVVETGWLDQVKDSILASINNSTGINQQEIAHQAQVSQELVALLLPLIMKENPVMEKDNRYFSGTSITEETLSDGHRALLEKILASKNDGLELQQVKDEKTRTMAGELLRMGFLVSLDRNIVYHRDHYEELKNRIMDLFNGREKITVPEAKEVTGLSRKYILPLLNKIETEGLIKRIGDFRIKA